MLSKGSKKSMKSTTNKSSSFGDLFELEEIEVPHTVTLSFVLKGENPWPGDCILLTIFNGQLLLETKWQDKCTCSIEEMPLNLKEPFHQFLIADRPITFILRSGAAGKVSKELDPLISSENRAGGSLDLLPLLLGEREVFRKVHLLNISTGEDTHCRIIVRAKSTGDEISGIDTVPLTLTLISAHCLPFAREGTVYIGAIGLNNVHDPVAINFGMSLSTDTAAKIVWASASNAGQAANTAYNISKEDMFIPEDLIPVNSESCISVYWKAMKRVLVKSEDLRIRLNSPFVVEIAGVPRAGKTEIRGRYMAFIDAGVLLQPGEYGVTVCAKLLFYNECDLPVDVSGLLELPPSSAKTTARETNLLLDESGHNAYIVVRLDLYDPLVLKPKLAALYESIGFPQPDVKLGAVDELYMDPLEDDPSIDIRCIRKKCGALLVHKELSALPSTTGILQMNQSIKRTAANRLLQRTRTMLKQFRPDGMSTIEWQDIVTAQHAACRRAVIASFAPQPPPPRPSTRVAVARSRMAGDFQTEKQLVQNNLQAAPGHPRMLLSKVFRCLEERDESEALNYLCKAISAQPRNRFLLWVFGGLTFNKDEGDSKAIAAFLITVKGANMDGVTAAIGWAALHTVYHYSKNNYAAFVAAKRMRKAFEISKNWGMFLQKWTETSGEEEIFWVPGAIDSSNPLLITAALFLCLKCHSFSEIILGCVMANCVNRGSNLKHTKHVLSDVYYIRTASLLMKRQFAEALELVQKAVKKFGPSAILSQMHATCLACLRGWDGDCESALIKADQAGAEITPALLLQAAAGNLNVNPELALQYAARAHKLAPSAYSALIIGRIYAKMNNDEDAERWSAVAVKTEPLLADGWAFLAILALGKRNVELARSMLRTAKQVGHLNPDIRAELDENLKHAKISTLPDKLVKDVCFCEYY